MTDPDQPDPDEPEPGDTDPSVGPDPDEQNRPDSDDSEDSEEASDADEAPDHSRHNRRAVAALVLVAVLAGIVLFFLTRSSEEPVDPLTTTTTTADVEVTVLESNVSEIATVKETVGTVEVYADEPDGWNVADVAVRFDDSDLPPASREEVPERDALPRPDHPIIGRYLVDTGWEFSNPGPYVPPQPTTFLVTERRTEWTKILLPVRPNGTEGWVRNTDIELSSTEYRIEIDLSERLLTAYDGDDEIAETEVVIGSPFTQTPTGLFYVTDIVPYEDPDGPFGPVALATNGYSEWMDEFSTGVPVVALHGTDQPERIGEAISNGCVRLPNDVVVMLAETIPQGTPILIQP